MIFYKRQLSDTTSEIIAIDPDSFFTNCDVCGREIPIDIVEEVTAFAEIGERFDLVTTHITCDRCSADGAFAHHLK